MKKFFMAIVLCLVCTVSFGQHWDNLEQYTNINSDIDVDSHGNILRTEIDYTLNKDYVILTKYKDFCKWDVDSTLIIDYDIVWKDNKQYTVPIYSKQYEVFHTKTLEEIKMPKVIYDEYKMGASLFKCGEVFICVGIPLVFTGMLLQVHGIKRMNEDAIIASSVFYGVGGTCVSVSIPLLCWGDHLKRTSNKDYKLYNLLKK